MATINLLKPNVYNKIAAGEVVERPASVVKELIENSIDAGATQIDISIINGGISLIEVGDNGFGIEGSEVGKAFLPHATSKVKDEDDLDCISTLGFRGEALASIASVSEITMITKTKEEEVGTKIELSGGQIVSETKTGAPNGTLIQVKNLFFNIPVRYKFLKKPKQEESAISEIISRLILANPTIAFKYMAENKVVYQSNGQGLENALYSVYGTSILSNVFPIDMIINNMRIEGFIGKPTFSKPNTTYQTTIVNGRYVDCRLISISINRVYEDYMMTRAYPFYVLHFDVPLEDIDVNVHPNKLEVRFVDQQKIFGSVNHVIDKALIDFRNSQLAQEVRPERQNADEINYENPYEHVAPVNNVIFNNEDVGVSENNSIINEIVLEKKTIDTENTDNAKLKQNVFIPQSNDEITVRPCHFEPQPVLQQGLFAGFSKNFDLLSIKIIGKIFNTFIIVEVEDKVYLIDQHAAHERILYDKLIDSLKKGELRTQPMLIPFILETNNIEHSFINDNLQNLKELGFEIEDFGGNSYKISTVPFNLPALELGGFFKEVLKDMNSILNLKTKDLVMDKFAQSACKHAVKGGDDLEKEEIVNLLEDVARSNSQLQCPHGRPFVVEITRREIDKWFKRVI